MAESIRSHILLGTITNSSRSLPTIARLKRSFTAPC